MGDYQATSHLLKTGCKQLAFLGPKKMSSSSKRRFDGYLKALEDNKIDFNEKKNHINISPNEDLKQQVDLFLDKNPNTDGIFAINDKLAIELIQILKVKNIKVPQEISIIGFDDIPACQYTSPKLTSIKQDIKTIAEETVKNIISYIKNPDQEKKTILVPTQLMIRESTK